MALMRVSLGLRPPTGATGALLELVHHLIGEGETIFVGRPTLQTARDLVGAPITSRATAAGYFV
jgi:hypothetical protein